METFASSASAWGLLGLLVAWGIYAYLKKQPAGNDLMRDLAEQIQTGAMAFLKRFPRGHGDGVGLAQFGEQRVDRTVERLVVLGGAGSLAVAGARRRPVDAAEGRIEELVRHAIRRAVVDLQVERLAGVRRQGRRLLPDPRCGGAARQAEHHEEHERDEADRAGRHVGGRRRSGTAGLRPRRGPSRPADCR